MSLIIGTANNSTASVTPAGLYLTRLTSIEEVESPFEPGKMQLKWVFNIESVIDSSDEDDAQSSVGSDIWGYSSKGGGLKHKARIWAQTIRGREYEEGEPLDAAELLGKRVKVSVVPHIKQDGSETTKVGALTTYKPKKATPKVEAPVEDDDDSDDF